MLPLAPLAVLTLAARLAPPSGSAHLHAASSPRTLSPRRTATGRTPAAPGVNTAIEERLDAFWRRAQLEEHEEPKSAEELSAQDRREQAKGMHLSILRRGDPRRPEIALTFDDGPHPVFTRRLLALLARERVPATFFVIGKVAESSPETLRAIIAGGHQLANHTFSHVTLTKIPAEEVRIEYRANDDLVAGATGIRMRFCRPPGGDYDPVVVRGAEAEGLTTVLWTDDPGDYARPGANVVASRSIAVLRPGAILLLHDGIEDTLAALPRIIAAARAKGLRFVRCDALHPG